MWKVPDNGDVSIYLWYMMVIAGIHLTSLTRYGGHWYRSSHLPLSALPVRKYFLLNRIIFRKNQILHFDGKQIWNCVWLHQVNKIVQSSNLWLEVLTPEWQSNQLMTLQSPMTKCRLIFLTPTFTAPAQSLHTINKNRNKEDQIMVNIRPMLASY